MVALIREDCLGRERRLTMESAWSILRDKTDNSLHRDGQRVACDYGLVQEVDMISIKILKSSVMQLSMAFRCVRCFSTCILVFMNTVVPLVIIKLHS